MIERQSRQVIVLFRAQLKGHGLIQQIPEELTTFTARGGFSLIANLPRLIFREVHPFLFLASLAAHFGDVFLDALLGFLDWLKVNDFSGTRRRMKLVEEAPGSFESDGLPVVLGADDYATLLYREGGFLLQNRTTKDTLPVSRRGLWRFTRRGMKGLRSQSLKLVR